MYFKCVHTRIFLNNITSLCPLYPHIYNTTSPSMHGGFGGSQRPKPPQNGFRSALHMKERGANAPLEQDPPDAHPQGRHTNTVSEQDPPKTGSTEV
jgi:hypothetical protein